MLTKNEISTLNLSPTKKDFVQIWNELLDVAGRLSERWDPTSTNESDPGIVILKALAGIADKLNYNIDKNTLEAFMPTAAQEDSMRKLCDMLGYNMKYYRSAETDVTIKYYNSDPSDEEAQAVDKSDGLAIPKFTIITNADKDVSYFTINENPLYISSKAPSVTVSCMEGQLVKCESTVDNNVITLAQLSEDNKFYLPEIQIAENGIFIYNVSSDGGQITDGTPWEKVDNLNIQAREARVFKFGYNSYEGRPYVEFPADCSELINDGLFIYYARTSGANGNVSVNTLTQIELPTGGNWSKVSAESFSATNTFASTSGANLETISQAYNNFKKTIGTFETLVTCRDYMNKIYNLVSDSGKPYVSNVLVTDIRNDINRAITICSCDDAGIYYKETPLTTTTVIDTITGTEIIDGKSVTTISRVVEKEQAINHFDLVIYPFKSYTQIRSLSTPIQSTYDSSFNYSPQTFDNIENELENTGLKTIAHNFVKPKAGDILSINNYLRLNAIVGTNNKVSTEEALLIKEKIKIALANAFNMRELDFGEEIPFESIVEVIEHADSKIKMVSLNEPDLYTTFTVIDKVESEDRVITKEYAVASDDWLTLEQATASKRFEYTAGETVANEGTFDTQAARQVYNKLVVRNILAGRVPLFKYNTTFTSEFSEKPYQVTNPIDYSDLPDHCLAYFNGDENKDTAYLLWCDPDTGDTYARTSVRGEPTNSAAMVENPSTAPIYEYTCTKTEVPKEEVKDGRLTPKYPDNIITAENIVETTTGNDNINKITKIKSECTIKPIAEGGDLIEDITLAAGEQIKFRAKNFRTTETYPAYVNYHLHLNRTNTKEATAAKAENLYTLINKSNLWSTILKDSNVVKSSLKQTITAGSINNRVFNIDELSIDEILRQSGCIKLSTKPSLAWLDATDSGDFDIIDNGEIKKDKLAEWGIQAEDDNTVLIYSVAAINTILEYVNSLIPETTSKTGWEISYAVEYMPFRGNTLEFWTELVKANLKAEQEGEIYLWRKYTGSSYPTGKYILEDGSKLLPFSAEYFGVLDAISGLQNRLQGIYIAEDLGNDAIAAEIANDTEYKLRDGEYLYIKYTPSSTSEDGTTEEAQAPVKKVYQKGTVIRPNGFTSGLQDSTAFQTAGNSPVDTKTYFNTNGTSETKSLFSLGVNEQIEIREPSSVTLDKNAFATDDTMFYVYKNFNNCPELETVLGTSVNSGKRSQTYILRDGEYLFYTDKNKSELAYYSTGTGITIEGNVKIPECDIIDISTILDSGISEIPWMPVNLSGQNDKIIFQEYQYKTLSQNDTLNTLRTVGRTPSTLDSNWCKCTDVSYTIAGETEPDKLPLIDIDDNEGNGWEACSLLEINVSPSVAQTLRNTAKVQTSMTLYDADDHRLKVIEAEPNSVLSLKANVTGQSSTGELLLSDVYLNTANAESFTFKITAEETPSVIEVQRNTIIPIMSSLPSGDTKITKGASSLSQVLLQELGSTVDSHGNTIYNALKLSTTILPNTYGIFSIYLKQEQGNDYNTVLKLLPGSDAGILSLVNSSEIRYSEAEGLRLNTGLNCIRVNKSCDIYITSDAPDGLLCFDSLRLVDISKTDYNQGTTYGLNLEQLGYLSTSDENTWNEIDSRARKNLKNALTKEALQEIDTRIQELKNDATKAEAALDEDKPKVEKIKDFLTNAINELDALLNNIDADADYNSTITSLITQFTTLENALKAEKDLQKSLEANTAIEDIIKRLAELLEDFDDIASLQESLTTELADLYNSILTNANAIEELPSTTIIDDFVNAVTSTSSVYKTDEILKNALKIASLTEINTEYNSQIDLIADEIIANADEELAKQVYLIKYKEILDLISDLYGTTAESSIINIIDNTINTVSLNLGNKEYRALTSNLNTAKANIRKLNINTLLNKIELAAADGVSEELILHLKALQAIFSSADNSLIQAIDNAIALAETLTDGEDASDELRAAITTISGVAWADIKASSQAIISKLQQLIEDAISDEDLTILDDSALDAALKTQLSAIITARAAIVKTVDLFSSVMDYDKLPFSTEAVLAVWPEYMKKDLLEKVEPLYNAIREIVRDLVDGTVTTNILTDRPVLKKLANITLFKKLYKRAKDLVYKYAQIEHRKTIVDALSNNALAIPDIITKLNTFTASSSSQVIYNLAVQLKTVSTNTSDQLDDSTNDVIAQQQILTELKEELAKLIKLDEDLLKITAEMLSPSILLLKDLPEDTFYDKVRDFINCTGGIKAQVLAEDLEGARTDILNKVNVNKLLKDDSLLPDSFTDKVTAYNNALALIPEDKPTEWDIFKILLDDNLKAAWKVTKDDSSFYWIDSTGTTVPVTNISEYTYRYESNTWYNSEVAISEDNLIRKSSADAELTDTPLIEILTKLVNGDATTCGVRALGTRNIPESFRAAFARARLEEQLLTEIRSLDRDKLFYYNTPVEADVAIDFNEGDSKLNTLMNPATNYDINNVNNSFVISKIDIGHLDSGIQLARSSRL